MKQREQIISIRTRLWFSLLRRRHEENSLISLARKKDPQASATGGTNKTIQRWKHGENLPQERHRILMEKELPGSKQLIDHALWDALEGANPVHSLDVVCPNPVGTPPLYRLGMWATYNAHLTSDDQYQIANAEAPFVPPLEFPPSLQTPSEIVAFLAWADYVLANLVWFDFCAMGRNDDNALHALWNAREGIRALTTVGGFETLAAELCSYLNEQYPLKWMLGLYSPEGEGESGQYQDLWDRGWVTAN